MYTTHCQKYDQREIRVKGFKIKIERLWREIRLPTRQKWTGQVVTYLDPTEVVSKRLWVQRPR